MEKILALAIQLMYSEQQNCQDELRKPDRVQGECNAHHYIHWFMQKAGPMQRGQDMLYSSRKQSIWKRWKQEL